MILRVTALSAAVVVSALAVGCMHDQDSSPSSGSSSGPMSNKPLEGNPGATTNQASGYPQSDPGAYHPQTDDTRQYRPAPATVAQPVPHN